MIHNRMTSFKMDIQSCLLSRGVLQLHDNTQTHIAHITVNLLNIWLCDILPHPPYSPDLASTALHFWPRMKKHP